MISSGGALGALAILVLEDDYLLADDARHVLEDAGARVIGPFGDAGEALAEAERRRPDCAVLDVNLGEGPSFAPARALRARGVPVVFVTGYEAEMIPQDLADAPCLQKPLSPRSVIDAVQALCGRR